MKQDYIDYINKEMFMQIRIVNRWNFFVLYKLRVCMQFILSFGGMRKFLNYRTAIKKKIN